MTPTNDKPTRKMIIRRLETYDKAKLLAEYAVGGGLSVVHAGDGMQPLVISMGANAARKLKSFLNELDDL